MEFFKLKNGVELPAVGLGVYKVTADQMRAAVASAWDLGYRHFDTAQMYMNEDMLGDALQGLGIPREELFLTTKIDNPNQGYEQTLASFQQSLKDLHVERVDQLLVHWPGQDPRRTEQTWKAFEKLYEEGLVRVIGVSNFTERHLHILEQCGNIAPMTNQIERSPRFHEPRLLELLRRLEIQPIAWSPLMRGDFTNPLLEELEEKYNRSAAQISLRWNLDAGVAVIPKSITPSRQRENIDVFDFRLEEEDRKRLDQLNTAKRTAMDPEVFDW